MKTLCPLRVTADRLKGGLVVIEEGELNLMIGLRFRRKAGLMTGFLYIEVAFLYEDVVVELLARVLMPHAQISFAIAFVRASNTTCFLQSGYHTSTLPLQEHISLFRIRTHSVRAWAARPLISG